MKRNSTRLLTAMAMGLCVSAAAVAQNYPAKIWAVGNLQDIPVNGWEFCETWPLEHQGDGVYKGIVKIVDNNNTYRPGEGDEPTEYPWGMANQKYGNRADIWFVDANWQTGDHNRWSAPAGYEERWIFPGRPLKVEKASVGAGAGPGVELKCQGGTYEFVLDIKNLTLTANEVAEDPLPWLPFIWCYGTIGGNPTTDPFACGVDDFRIELPHYGNGQYSGQVRVRTFGDISGVLAIKKTSPLAHYDSDGFITNVPVSPGEWNYDGEEHQITVANGNGYKCYRFAQSGLYNVEVDLYNGKINIVEEAEEPEMIYVAGTFSASDEENLDVVLQNSLGEGVTLEYNEDEALYMGSIELEASPAVKGDNIPENSAAVVFSINGTDWEAFREAQMGPHNDGLTWCEVGDEGADLEAQYCLGTYVLSPGKYDVALDVASKAVTFTRGTGSVSNVAVDASKPVVAVSNGVITVAGADDVKVYTTGGALVSEGRTRVNVSTGVYVVVADGTASKVIVK